MSLALPTEDGGFVAVPLAPSGQQVDLAVTWGTEILNALVPLAGEAALLVEAGAALSLDHGHVDVARAASGYAGIVLRL